MFIHIERVDVVDQYEYLSAISENTLKFEQNTEAIIKKAYHCQFFLRKLK